MLIDPEPAGPLVQREGVRAEDPFHPGACLPLEFQVGGLHGPGGGDQVGDLLLDAAGTAPVPDVLIRRCLDTMLDLADPGEMLTRRRRQRPRRKARVLADLAQAGAQRRRASRAELEGGVLTVRYRQLPGGLEGGAAQPQVSRIS